VVDCHEISRWNAHFQCKETPLSSPVAATDQNPVNDRRGLSCVLGIALVLRVLACYCWADDLTLDRDAYLGIARNIYVGNGFCAPGTTTPTAFRPPVYPILIGTLRLALPEAVAIVITNIAAGLATIWAVWILVDLWWQPTRWKQVAATLAVAADPLLLRYTAQPMTECLFTALTAWTVVGVTRLWLNPFTSIRTAWLTGLAAGLAALCRPTLYPYDGLMLVCLPLFAPQFNIGEFRVRLNQAAHFALAVTVVISLWIGRNFVVFHEPLLTTTHGGYTLLLGNNPVFYDEVARKPWGTVWEHESLIRWQESLATEIRRELGSPVDEFTADRWHAKRAWAAINHDPGGFRWAMWYRIRSFWSLSPRGPEMKGGLSSRLVSVWYATLFSLALMGFVSAVYRLHPAVLIGGLLIATVAALHLLYWTDTRMRAPLHPVLIAFATGIATNSRRQNEQADGR